jgi:carbamate kinase
MMILTGVPRVALDFGKPGQREISRASLSQMRRWHADGHFPPGNMGPKVEAAIRFVEAGGRRAIITSLDCALPALHGVTGTHIVPDEEMREPSSAAVEGGVA